MIPRPLHPRARGFTLLELMGTFALLGVFFLMVAFAFSAMMRLNRASNEGQAAMNRWERAAATLRADAWSASEMAVAGEARLELRQPGGGVVVWHIADGAGTLVRSSGVNGDAAAATEWPGVAPGGGFVTDGAGVLLRVPGRAGAAGPRVRLQSQVLLVHAATGDQR